ncbi:MAG: 6,7-dimethyl-8-ribityllumazine synthase [Lentimonas sp.]|jgi:6,7-dimethyl-8-ribityllumazine synthase
MSLDTPNPIQINAAGFRFGIIAARYNEALVDSLIRHASAGIVQAGAPEPCIERVPGSAELPMAASLLANNSHFDAIIVIGVVIAGDTNHHNIIGDSTAIVLQNLSIQLQTPIINGILVVENLAQAEARAGQTINRGKEFAQAALEMAQFTKKWKTQKNP